MTKKQRAPRDGARVERQKKPRRRRTPSWLNHPEFDAVARSRCLMLLSVLSGEKSVTEAIQEAKIYRPTYYQLETRALNAMLAALNPLARQGGSPDLSAAAARIEQLQRQVKHLEQEKRRTQRLLLLARKSIRAPVTTGRRGRPPKNALLGLIGSGRPRSRLSKAKAMPESPSIPTRAGENAP